MSASLSRPTFFVLETRTIGGKTTVDEARLIRSHDDGDTLRMTQVRS